MIMNDILIENEAALHMQKWSHMEFVAYDIEDMYDGIESVIRVKIRCET